MRLLNLARRKFYWSRVRFCRLFKPIPNKANMPPFVALLFARRAYAR